MEPYNENIQTFATMFEGYDQAFVRFENAAVDAAPSPAYIALFEALNWAVALDDRAAKHWTPEGKPLGFGWRERAKGAEVMRGVRFARNSVHHQWSDALEFTKEGGSSFPVSVPGGIFEWRWRPASELPEPDKRFRTKRWPQERASYCEKLERDSALKTLRELGMGFYFLRLVLEPSSIPREGG